MMGNENDSKIFDSWKKLWAIMPTFVADGLVLLHM